MTKEDWKTLLSEASAARAHAYAPYSNFRMGAAVRSASGKVYSAGNVENVSLGLTMCAERAAIYAMLADGERHVEAVALVSPRTKGTLTTPCGACCQVISEFGPAAVIAVADTKGRSRTMPLSALLPGAFTKTEPPGK